MKSYLDLCRQVLCEGAEPVVKALEAEFSQNVESNEIDVCELTYEAYEQVTLLRAQVRQYNMSGRQEEYKPCINHVQIANRIENNLAARHQVAYVNRAYAYKVMFISYLISKMVSPHGANEWWENTYIQKLSGYLESTDYFRGVRCAERWAVILNELPHPAQLPIEVELKIPESKPQYPPLHPIYVQKVYNVYKDPHIDTVHNENCMQFYKEITGGTFLDGTNYGK